jgi:hypothetical protein
LASGLIRVPTEALQLFGILFKCDLVIAHARNAGRNRRTGDLNGAAETRCNRKRQITAKTCVGFLVVKAATKIVINQFHNANYAFAILTLRNAHSMLAFARQISVANATTQLIVKIEPEMGTIREHLELKVDIYRCQSMNCCTALLRNIRLAFSANGDRLPNLLEVLPLTC